MQDRQVVTKIIQYRDPANVVYNYNAICFVNQGTTNATINGALTLEPGDQVSWSYNANEVDKSYIDIGFPDGQGLVVVIVSYYMNYNNQ